MYVPSQTWDPDLIDSRPCSCQYVLAGLPFNPLGGLCAGQRGVGWGLGGQCRLADQEVFRPNAAGMRFDWQAQCF